MILNKLRKERGKKVIIAAIVIVASVIFLSHGIILTNEQVDNLEKVITETEVKQSSGGVLVDKIPTVAREVINQLELEQKQGIEANTEELINKLIADGYGIAQKGLELEDIYENYKIVGISFGDKKITVQKRLIEKNRLIVESI